MSGYHRQTVDACNRQIDALVGKIEQIEAEHDEVLLSLDAEVFALGDAVDGQQLAEDEATRLGLANSQLKKTIESLNEDIAVLHAELEPEIKAAKLPTKAGKSKGKS